MRKNNLFVIFVFWMCFSCFWISIGCADELEPLYPGYPTQFDIRGRVDAISNENVIINDSVYTFSSEIVFKGPHGRVLSHALLGANIGGIVGESGLLSSLWLIDKKNGQPSLARESKSSGTHQRKKSAEHGMIKVNGVWKNIE